MLDDNADSPATNDTTAEAVPPGDDAPATPRKRAARAKKTPAAKAADAPAAETTGDAIPDSGASDDPPAKPKKKATAKKTAKKAAAPSAESAAPDAAADSAPAGDPVEAPAAKKATTRKRTAKKTTAKKKSTAAPSGAEPAEEAGADATGEQDPESGRPSAAPLFQAPKATTTTRRTRKSSGSKPPAEAEAEPTEPEAVTVAADDAGEDDDESGTAARRRRRRGGRRRRKSGGESDTGEQTDDGAPEAGEAAAGAEPASESGEGGSASSRRRRRRRRSGEDDGDGGDDPANTVTRVRSGRSAANEITAVSGSTRLEAKKQRRREGREAGRRRAPIVSEAEFLARRESVNRVMVIRQHDDITQIAVLEDNVLVEHYVARESQTSLIGNVYLGRVQNVLPSMEAAFIDIGKGRNAVLYAGEVNWSSLGHKEGQPRKIESVLSSGQSVLVQVTKDPIGHKGARLTSQISLAGRFLVYVPDGTTSGISRKLPDTERNRLKNLLKDIVPESAGVIVRTAAEGAAEDELTRDVERLKARWEDIEKKAGGSAPQLLYGEPDLTLKVVRDLFTEDFAKLVIEGDEAWDTVQGYVVHVAPDLEERLERYVPKKDQDVFAAYRIDEQIKKGLERKVWLPSGGSLIIDRTEAMTVIDVNTGKFTGSGGNLEETVTKNNLEAAEEIVRQLRLRDIGGIIVVDFIDMVLESNRDLVLRRLVECLGRDRTRHQVAEVTSLGLVQMTRKRIGTGLLESFSHDCPTCHGRGVVIEEAPVEPNKVEDEPRRARRSRGRGRGADSQDNGEGASGRSSAASAASAPSPKDIAAMARHHADDESGESPDTSDLEPVEQPDDVDGPDLGSAADETSPAEPDEAAEAPEALEAPETIETDHAETEAATAEQAEPEQPTEEPADETPAPPAEPARPTVATRTRRRAASRPAGPPSQTATVAPEAAVDGGSSTEADPAAVPDEGGVPALHVPVKRKGGARKR